MKSFFIKNKRKLRNISIVLVIFIAVYSLSYWQNNGIEITEITYVNGKIPINFNDFKILQISDLHNANFGTNQFDLIKLSQQSKPDVILITGDLIDCRNTNIDVAMEYIDQAVKIAPVYFVTGNHEYWSNEYNKLKEKLKLAGVTLLENGFKILSKKNQKIKIIGLNDPDDNAFDYGIDPGTRLNGALNQLVDRDHKLFTILLSHRPELFKVYVGQNIDLTFTGHAHGGQIRLPFLGGIYAPNQGFLPMYTSTEFIDNNSTMIVSRGLGNSIIPQRVFNRPELVLVTLKCKE